MKTHTSRRNHGFTLVELLVVIAIIAVLAGAGFAAGNAAIQKARKTTALATCVAIESAVNNFYSEYGSMPVKDLASDQTYKTDSGEGVKLIKVLLGYEGTGNATLNTRGIRFLSVKDGKKLAGGGKDGLITTGTPPNITVTGLYDPWGGPYNVMLDGDYDESIAPKPKGAANSPTLNGRRVAAWSEGADYKTKMSSADDVKTW